jgi:hypothetical protein
MSFYLPGLCGFGGVFSIARSTSSSAGPESDWPLGSFAAGLPCDLPASDFGLPMTRIISQLPDQSIDYSQLRQRPEIAALIGEMAATFALLERQVPDLLHHILGGGNSDADAIAGIFISFSGRIDLIETLLASRNKEHDDGHFQIAANFCIKIREANKARNRYVHSIYVCVGDTTRMITYASDSKKKTQKRLVTAELIRSDLRRVHDLIFYLSGFLRRNERPPEQYWRLH